MESTYVDVPLNKVQRFIELHKKVTDLSQGEGRTIQEHWVYRHWYGSGDAILIYDEYNSAQYAIDDNFNAAYKKKYEGLSADAKKEMDAVFTEWWSFFNGHWDEMRVINYEKDFVSKEEVNKLESPLLWIPTCLVQPLRKDNKIIKSRKNFINCFF